MPLSRLQFRPGIVKDVTEYTNSLGWWDSDKVRFRAGHPETIGGWVAAEPNQTFLGICRALHQWSLLTGSLNIGLGTNLKYYILNADQYFDITPQRTAINLASNPFTTVSNPLQLQVAITGHGALVNDFITFSGATIGVGNYTASQLNQQFQVAAVLDVNNLLLTGTVSCPTPGQTGGGAAVVATPDINTGPADASIPVGYGAGQYGLGPYGGSQQSRFGSLVVNPRIWHHDNFGENLVINPRGGGIYYWNNSAGGLTTRAKLLSTLTSDVNVPAVSNGVWVSPISQAVVAMGCCPVGSTTADPMQIRWSNIADPLTWTPSITNSAGGQRLASGSYIVGWLVTFQETLIWTDTSLYAMDYTGSSFVFSFRLIADGISLISPNSAASNGSTVFWMDTNSFRVYNGSTSELPCAVKSYVFGNLNRLQSWKVFAAHNHNFSEVWWFYPSSNSTEIDSYVIYNYADNLWSLGTLNRTAWMDLGKLPTPLACDQYGALYFHETGTDANGTSIASYIESADVDIDNGDQYTFLSKVIPDIQFVGSSANNQQANMDILKRNSSGQEKVIERSLSVNPNTRNLFVRSRGRRLSVKFRSNQIGTGWRLGTTEVEIAPDGRR